MTEPSPPTPRDLALAPWRLPYLLVTGPAVLLVVGGAVLGWSGEGGPLPVIMAFAGLGAFILVRYRSLRDIAGARTAEPGATENGVDGPPTATSSSLEDPPEA